MANFLPGKIEIFLTRIHDPPDFKPDWHRCLKRIVRGCCLNLDKSEQKLGGLHIYFCYATVIFQATEELPSVWTNAMYKYPPFLAFLEGGIN